MTSKRIWRAPLWLAASILLGLLSALLGTGAWYGVSWVAMTAPLAVAAWKIFVTSRRSAPSAHRLSSTRRPR